jgi:ABC-type sugar transport system ATPase subunit
MLDEARTLTEAAERLSARLGVSEDSDRTRVEALEMRRDAMITRARALIAEVKVLARGL